MIVGLDILSWLKVVGFFKVLIYEYLVRGDLNLEERM